MVINYEALKKALLELIDCDDVSSNFKQGIIDFQKQGDIRSFSNCKDEMNKVFPFLVAPRYKTLTGEYLPNVFNTNEEEQPHGDQV